MTTNDDLFRTLDTGLESDVPTECWFRPERLTVQEDALVWNEPFEVQVRPDRGMLLQFTRLRTADDIARYATKWGPLGLCYKHPEAPVAHLRSSHVQQLVVREDTGEQVLICGNFASAEPIQTWLFYSRWFAGILALARKQQESPGIQSQVPESLDDIAVDNKPAVGVEEIAAAFPEIAYVIAERQAEGLRVGVNLMPYALTSGLASRVTDLLEMTGSRIGLSWHERPRLVFGSVEPTLLGALALQLAFAIAGAPDTFICSTCGRMIDPTEQRVRRGFRQYCEQCRTTGAPQREASRRYRGRQSQKKRRKT